MYVGDELPRWDEVAGRFGDPVDGAPLPTWDEALDAIGDDPAASPAHVVKLGTQLDYQGILGTADDKVGKAISYLTKYLAKSIADTYGDDDEITTPQAIHLDRLHREVRWLPCSPTCSNWLQFGVQPQAAEAGMRPGWCPSKAHDRHHLGLGGRRVLVSRQWTGKTLSDHKADRAEVVRQTLAAAGVDLHDADRYAATRPSRTAHPASSGNPSTAPTMTTSRHRHGLMTRGINERICWRTDYERAKRAGPTTDDTHSATDHDPATPAA